MFLEQETRNLIVKITKEEVEKLEIIKKYNDFIQPLFEMIGEPEFQISYAMTYIEEECLGLLYIHTISGEDIFTQTIPVNIIVNELCGTQGIEMNIKSIISDKEKIKLNKILSGIINNEDNDSEENSWYIELEFDAENYVKFIESNVKLELEPNYNK